MTHWLIHGDEKEVTLDLSKPMRKDDVVYFWRESSNDIYGWGKVTDTSGESPTISIENWFLKEGQTITLDDLRSLGLLKTVDLITSRRWPDALIIPPIEAPALKEVFRLKRSGRTIKEIREEVDRFRFDPHRADAAYKPFPPFSDWANTDVDEIRWSRYSAELDQLKSASPELFKRSLEIVERASAFDTGAIEGLYETDRGLTFTVAKQLAMWELAVDKQGEMTRPLFEAQLNAYDAVLDLATQARPIAEAWIRELHRQICEAQQTYPAWTELGWQELKLPKGEYKSLPNHVLLADGSVHSYAPVDMTPTEMYRLCEELRSDEFKSAHPAVQASYAHYALTVIHPFADGNGRVARALASVFTYRCCSVPILILSESRNDYLSALREADAGNFRQFVRFIMERTFDAIKLAQVSIEAAAAPSLEESAESIKRLYVTKGGYSQDQVDSAALSLMELFKRVAGGALTDISKTGSIHTSIGAPQQGYAVLKAEYRLPLGTPYIYQINLSTSAPASASLVINFGVDVPRDCGKEDDIIIHDLDTGKSLEARITELLPAPTAALQMRLSAWTDGLLRGSLAKLAEMARSSLTQR